MTRQNVFVGCVMAMVVGKNHPPPRHIMHKYEMELSHSQSGAPPGTDSIPSREQSLVC